MREFAGLMRRVNEKVGVPGALVFGQRRVGEVMWEHNGEHQVLMRPITKNAWPFISDTKPHIVETDAGMCARWGLDAAHVVEYELVEPDVRSEGYQALCELEGLLQRRGISCAARREAV